MKKWIKISLVLIALFIVVVLLVYHFVINKPHPDYENLKADYSLSAGDLYQQFSADEKKAGQMYNGKVIEINGVFKAIEKNDSLAVIVFSFKEGVFGDEGIRCTFLSKFTGKVNQLTKNSDIKIKGYCSSFNDIDVILDKCSLTEN